MSKTEIAWKTIELLVNGREMDKTFRTQLFDGKPLDENQIKKNLSAILKNSCHIATELGFDIKSLLK